MNQRRAFRSVGLVLLLSALNSAWAAAPAADLAAPAVDHHQHLLSPQGAALLNAPHLATDVPADVSALLLAHEAAWEDAARLAPLYADDAAVLDVNDNRWILGKSDVAEHLSKRFARPYRILPLAWRRDGDSGYLSALYSRGEGVDRRNVGSVAMRLVRDADMWRIAMEYPVFPGPVLQQPLDAERLISLLDAAGIRRAAVLSVAYWYQSPMYTVDDPVRRTREENEWTAAQVARHPDRLVAFCSLNPISDAALELLRECAKDGRFKGLKLHFGNANSDVTNPDHLRRVRAVFAAANAAHLAIVVHARGGDEYDARHARIFVEQLLPAAPDVPVQMAHLWGGAQFAPEALAVYAQAIESRKPATGRFIFDVSDAAFAARTPELAQLIATRMRQIGMDRMYYGSDAAFDGHADPATSWQTFRKGLPLTDAEFLQIQANVAPYMRE